MRVKLVGKSTINGGRYPLGYVLDVAEPLARAMVTAGSATYVGSDGEARTRQLRSGSDLWAGDRRVSAPVGGVRILPRRPRGKA